MSDYIGITEAQSNPFAPFTSELVKQLRDNPIAIAEGAEGAPRVAQIGIEPALFIGSNGAFGTSATGFTDLNTNSIIRADYSGGMNTAGINPLVNGNVQVRASNDNGSTWSGFQSLEPTGRGTSGYLFLNTNTGVAQYQSMSMRQAQIGGPEGQTASTGFAERSTINFSRENINAVQFRYSDTGGSYAFSMQYLCRAEE